MPRNNVLTVHVGGGVFLISMAHLVLQYGLDRVDDHASHDWDVAGVGLVHDVLLPQDQQV